MKTRIAPSELRELQATVEHTELADGSIQFRVPVTVTVHVSPDGSVEYRDTNFRNWVDEQLHTGNE